ncbi:ABC transporter ATP-binding protein [Dactylosporangium sp. CA-233914]|uniref:ABC transporter ATP-binding protein n=1 Tax=Dactylosporangium sp. CA-233914 TaxID=3239934 RepID=UPI003D8F7629
MPVVELTDIRKSFGSVRALNGISLTVEDGENVAVLGPSGSGKSTLLRIIAGLDQPDRGKVTFDGQSQQGIPAHQRDCAIVFQHFALYPHMNALRNITTGLRHGLGLAKAEAEARARDITARMKVDDLLDRKPREMSGGQRQRIALARALARRSGLVLLDEPLSGLDAQLHTTLRLEIAGLLRAAGATTINVTHDQLDALAMADRIAVIDAGQLEQVGTPDELYTEPATTFVAAFIGTPPMNLLPVDDLGTSSFDHIMIKTGEPVTLGVRAEHLTLGPAATEAWRLTGVVGLVEPTGLDRIVQILTDRGDSVAFRCPIPAAPPVGTRVTVSAPLEAVHVYARASGRRLGHVESAGIAITASAA